MNWKITATIAAVAIIGMLGWDLQQYSSMAALPHTAATSSVQAAQPPSRMSPEEIQAAADEKLLPLAATATTLDGSDSDVMLATNDLAPQLVEWLTPSEQIRKWVALIDQIANGKVPQIKRPLDYPLAAFEVEHDGNKLLFDKLNYERTDWLINVIVDISPRRLAHYYHAWSPVLEMAQTELGGRDSFDKRLRAAIQNVLAVKSLTSAPELTLSDPYYKYTDPKLEHASSVEKLLWRIGPDSTNKLQAFLRALERQL